MSFFLLAAWQCRRFKSKYRPFAFVSLDHIRYVLSQFSFINFGAITSVDSYGRCWWLVKHYSSNLLGFNLTQIAAGMAMAVAAKQLNKKLTIFIPRYNSLQIYLIYSILLSHWLIYELTIFIPKYNSKYI